MIVGIGVDIVETARVERLLRQFGERFARRILTADELLEFERRERAPAYLASRFAAKEAVAKAFGTGIGKQLGFHAVQIDSDGLGKPVLKFIGQGQELLASRQVGNAMVSLADEKHYALAMVVLES